MTDQHEFVQILGPWLERKGALYERLARAVEAAIRRGELPMQTHLPAERWLATRLGLSRSTVVAAYTLLGDWGWVTTRRGSGTEVSQLSPDRSAQVRRGQVDPLAHGPVIDSYLSEERRTIDLSAGAPAWPAGLDPELVVIPPGTLRPLLDDYGYVPQGLARLRQAVADYYSGLDVPTDANHILITTGAQQAISLLAAFLLQRGDRVIIENPTFFGAIDTFRAAGVHFEAVPVETSGLDFACLSRLMSARASRVMYMIPSFHNPTGHVLSDMARREIVRMAHDAGVLLIEDLTLANNGLDREAPPPMAAHAAPDEIVTIGSMSKVFWAGLRVGWIRGSAALIERMSRFKVVSDLGSSLISQQVAIQLLPHLELVKSLRREELGPRRDMVLEALRSSVPGWECACPEGGLFVWAKLPRGDSRELAQEALRHGVMITPGTNLSVDGSHSGWLRLPFLLPDDQLEMGMNRLLGAWKRYEIRLPA